MFDRLKRALGASVPAEPEPPVSFGYKIEWLAVRSEDAAAVIAALRAMDARYRKVTPCSWSHGIDRAYQMGRKAFVTPPVKGWTMVAGWAPPHDQPDALPDVLVGVSRRLGTRVCFFGNHRGVSYAAYGYAEKGKLVRLYSFADGETYHDRGEPTPAERALGIRYWDEIEKVEASDEDALFEALPDEATVHDLATRWSINPNADDWASHPPGVGFLIQ